MKQIVILVMILNIVLFAFGQQNDTSYIFNKDTFIYLQPMILEFKGGSISADKLISYTGFHFEILQLNENQSERIYIRSYEYKYYSNNQLLLDGIAKGPLFDSALRKIFEYAKVGDSICFVNFKTSKDAFKNYKVKPFFINITSNTIYHANEKEKKLITDIRALPEFKELSARYGTCGGASIGRSLLLLKPKMNTDATYSAYGYELYGFDGKTIDYKFEFRHYYKSQNIYVYDYIKKKEFSILNWRKSIRNKLKNKKNGTNKSSH